MKIPVPFLPRAFLPRTGMSAALLSALALAACASPSGTEASVRSLEPGPAEAERAAVLATLDSWNRGWAEGDAALAVQDYALDVDWTNAFGDRFQGRPALQAGLEFIFGLDFVMAGDSGAEEYADVRFLRPDLVLLRSKLVRVGQQRSDGSAMPDRHIHHLRVLERRVGRWQIVSHLISQAQEKGPRGPGGVALGRGIQYTEPRSP